MSVRWFIEASPFSDAANNDAANIRSVILAAKELGLDVRVEKHIPFGGSDYEFFRDPGPVVFYGSLNGCRDCYNRKLPWHPLAWADWERLKTCSVCGEVNEDLTLADREWYCGGCDTKHDRDYNASVNLENAALQFVGGKTPVERMALAQNL